MIHESWSPRKRREVSGSSSSFVLRCLQLALPQVSFDIYGELTCSSSILVHVVECPTWLYFSGATCACWWCAWKGELAYKPGSSVTMRFLLALALIGASQVWRTLSNFHVIGYYGLCRYLLCRILKSGSYFFLSLTCPCLQARKLEVEDRQWGSILGALTGGAGGAALGNALGSAAGRNIFFNFP